MERNKLLLQILNRLAKLEIYRDQEHAIDIEIIDVEIKELRLKYQDVMNNICPLLRSL